MIRSRLSFDLLDASLARGCPICGLALRTANRHLDALSYEGVNDPGIRASLRASRGFCNHHAWRFLEELRDGLGTAIIYNDILNALLRSLAGRADPAALAPSRRCPTCQARDASALRYLQVLLQQLADASFRRTFAGSDGLCRPHLALAQARCSASEGAALAELALSQLSRTAQAELPLASELLAGAAGAVDGDSLAGEKARVSRVLAGEDQLTEALERGGCALCLLAERASWQWLEPLTRAGATEEAVTGLLSLCNRHAWRLSAGHPEVLDLARAALASPQGELELATSTPARRLRGLLGRQSPQQRLQRVCTACMEERATAAAAAELLGTAFAKPEVAAALRRSPGLCLAHLVLALQTASDPATLAEAHARRWRMLAGELATYIRKNDYRFRDEPWGREATSPRRAVTAIAGARGAR